MLQTDIKQTIALFMQEAAPENRYSSFDYCFIYFKTTEDYLVDIEKSCLTLSFYLASWGMYRGSSFLLGKSAKYFEPTVEYLSSLPRSAWEIDVDSYTNENVVTILEIYQRLKETIINGKNADLTLITKVMLGVFGFIPAYDDFFCRTFRSMSEPQCGFRVVNKKSLSVVRNFYWRNKEDIDQLSNSIYTKDFITGKETKINYTKAKIIDMYGFAKGLYTKRGVRVKQLNESGHYKKGY